MDIPQQSNEINIDKLVEERLNLLPEPLKFFILDKSKQEEIKSLVNDYPELGKERKRKLRNYFFLSLLLYIEIEQLKSKLQEDLEIEARLAATLVNEFIFILPFEITNILAKPIENVIDPTKVGENMSTDEVEGVEEEKVSGDDTEPVTEAEPEPVKVEPAKPLQTMAEDMKRVHSYGVNKSETSNDNEEPVHQSAQTDLTQAIKNLQAKKSSTQ